MPAKKNLEASKTSGSSPTHIMSTIDAAKYIGVSKKTLLKYCHERHIAYMRYPGGEFRFRQSALDLFMAHCTIRGERAA
jgi:excisionase family DNA binding protein